MANQYVSKVVLGSEVKLDLTGDTVTAADLKKGVTAHDKSGAPIVGTSEKDSDTSDATAAAAEILSGKTAYARESKLTGSMPNNGAKTLTIGKKDDAPAIPAGFHDGSGKAVIDPDEKAKLIPANIRKGITLLGVAGSMSGNEDEKPQSKTVTPSFAQQVVTPDTGYTCLTQVTVAKIPVSEVDNSAGGLTLTIGA